MNLSVIIPCYNGGATLGEQLSALSQQVWDKAWEVILADNGSTDDSVAVAESFKPRLPCLKIIDASQKRGRPYACNLGVYAASGLSVTFIDADDVVAPGWLAALGDALEKNEFVASRHDFTRLNSSEVLQSRKNAQSESLQSYHPTYLPHAGGCGLGVRRELHLEVGGFDESVRVLEDTDYCWRIQLAGHDLVFVRDALIYVRFRSDDWSIYLQAKTYGEFNVLLYKRYRPKGMPALSWLEGAKAWLGLLETLPRLREKAPRQRWIWQFGWRFGRLLGSLKYRVLAL